MSAGSMQISKSKEARPMLTRKGELPTNLQHIGNIVLSPQYAAQVPYNMDTGKYTNTTKIPLASEATSGSIIRAENPASGIPIQAVITYESTIAFRAEAISFCCCTIIVLPLYYCYLYCLQNMGCPVYYAALTLYHE